MEVGVARVHRKEELGALMKYICKGHHIEKRGHLAFAPNLVSHQERLHCFMNTGRLHLDTDSNR